MFKNLQFAFKGKRIVLIKGGGIVKYFINKNELYKLIKNKYDYEYDVTNDAIYTLYGKQLVSFSTKEQCDDLVKKINNIRDCFSLPTEQLVLLTRLSENSSCFLRKAKYSYEKVVEFLESLNFTIEGSFLHFDQRPINGSYSGKDAALELKEIVKFLNNESDRIPFQGSAWFLITLLRKNENKVLEEVVEEN